MDTAYSDFPLKSLNVGKWTRTIILCEWRNQAIIRKHVEAQGGKVELGTELVGLEQDETSVTAKLAKTVDGRATVEKATFEFVVGADGAKSK